MKSRDDLSEGEKKIETYLTFLARDRNVAPSTQNQALKNKGSSLRLTHEQSVFSYFNRSSVFYLYS